MIYDITNPIPPRCQTSVKAQNASNYCSHRLKRHARTPRSDAFPYTWRTHQRRGISVSRPQLEGILRPNG